MKHLFFKSKTLFTAIVLCVLGCINVAAANIERPKLVIGIAVDQMRWDYLYRYYDLYTEGGFKRLMNEGYNYENTMINYIPSVTAIGHSSIYTGSVPAIHGIAGNNFYKDGKFTYCCADSTVSTVGTKSKAGMMSPCNLLATTIGDELKVATNFQSKVIGIALKDRAAILPAGHGANGAYWMDFDNAKFLTMTYYMNKLPNWVEKYNKTIGKATKDQIRYSPLGNKLTVEMAKAAIEGEQLGMGAATDMLTISFSCPDMIGHKYGTHAPITQDIYTDLDQRLADFFSFLDQKIGKGNYLVFLTADHGAANNIKMLQDHKIAAGGFYPKEVKEKLDKCLQEKFHTTKSLVYTISDYKVFLDHNAIADMGLDLATVRTAVVDCLKNDSQFAFVADLEHIAEASMPAVIKEKAINGYNRFRSGDVQLILQPAHYEIYNSKDVGGTTHGLWNPYDAHIPFLVMGWHVKHGVTQAQTYITDIAPTICSLIHIQMPNGCIGTSAESK